MLSPKLKEAVTRNDYELGMKALDQFCADVEYALVYERGMGRLRTISEFDWLASAKDELAGFQWRAAECSTLLECDELMRPNDEIVEITFDYVKFTSGPVSRDMISEYCRREIAGNLIAEEKLRGMRQVVKKVSSGDGTGQTDQSGRFVPHHGAA